MSKIITSFRLIKDGEGYSIEIPQGMNVTKVRRQIDDIKDKGQRTRANNELDYFMNLAHVCWKLGSHLERDTLREVVRRMETARYIGVHQV